MMEINVLPAVTAACMGPCCYVSTDAEKDGRDDS